VVDHAVADVTDDYAVLLASVAAGDVLLIHDVFTDARAVKDLAVEFRVLVEDGSEACAEIGMATGHDSSLAIFNDAVWRKARDKAIEVTFVVRLYVRIHGIVHRLYGL
jgi:hypothetical protein